MNDDVYTQRIASGGVFYPTMGRDTILAPIQHPRTRHWVLLVCDMGNMRVQIFDIMNHSDKKLDSMCHHTPPTPHNGQYKKKIMALHVLFVVSLH
jgi:hypothetical protein